MNKSLEEWIEFYNKKAPEKFQRDERFGLFYAPDKGFCELGVTENLILVWQVCGDGRYWKKFADDVARKYNLKVCVAVCTRKEIPAYIRTFGFKVTDFVEKGGFRQYRGVDKQGCWGVMTEYEDDKGLRKFWVSWEVKVENGI